MKLMQISSNIITKSKQSNLYQKRAIQPPLLGSLSCDSVSFSGRAQAMQEIRALSDVIHIPERLQFIPFEEAQATVRGFKENKLALIASLRGLQQTLAPHLKTAPQGALAEILAPYRQEFPHLRLVDEAEQNYCDNLIVSAQQRFGVEIHSTYDRDCLDVVYGVTKNLHEQQRKSLSSVILYPHQQSSIEGGRTMFDGTITAEIVPDKAYFKKFFTHETGHSLHYGSDYDFTLFLKQCHFKANIINHVYRELGERGTVNPLEFVAEYFRHGEDLSPELKDLYRRFKGPEVPRN